MPAPCGLTNQSHPGSTHAHAQGGRFNELKERALQLLLV
jgi:hypothetical protein